MWQKKATASVLVNDLSVVLAGSPTHPFAPHAKTAGFHMAAHEFDDFGFRQSALGFDIVKAGLIIPCHGDNFRCGQLPFIRARCGGHKIIGEFSISHGLYTL